MNICLFTDTYVPDINGVATSVHSLATLLRKNGHKVYVVTSSAEKELIFKDDVLYIPGLVLKKIYGYKLANVFNSKAYKIIKNWRLDICHINTEFTVGQFGFYIAEKMNIPTVYTYHTMYEEYTYYINKGYFDRFSKWVIREYAKSCLLRSTECISPSEKTKNYLKNIDTSKYINIVPTGFDLTRFTLAKDNKEELDKLRKKYDIKDDEHILVCLGRIAKEKRFDIVIDGYAKFIATYGDMKTRILFVGAGPDLDNIKALAKKFKIEKNIIFVGKVDVSLTQYYYSLGEIFLNASISETQGLTFMEAMASNLVLLCRFDNSLLGVIDNRVNGYFYIDENDFKEKLYEILTKNKEEIDLVKKRALESIDRFSDKSFYSNIMEVYTRARRKKW